MALPININDLLTGNTVEWDRLEFKSGWNPEDILHTLCAFANDINNWGGGYIIIGIEEKDGIPILPPKGLNQNQIDKIQKELIKLTHCIDPFYSPVTEPVTYKGKQIFIIWGPGGLTRPYKAPTTLSVKGQKQYYVRRGSATVIANHTEIKQLMDMAATVPFDDRINHNATIEDLDLVLIRAFLQEIKSDLSEELIEMSFVDLCIRMRIASGSSEYFKPLNVGLLFFCNKPDRFFPGAITELVQFKDEEGTEFTETIFRGPIHQQAIAVLNYIQNNIITEKIEKIENEAKAQRAFNYSYQALEEAIVNAYYHRSYEHRSSIEIRIYPNRIEILSFPGPPPPIDNESFKKRKVVTRDYRNRRIGDFLKELDLTEGRGTGIPKIYKQMERNGSPLPLFETDRDKINFLVTLPIHEAFLSEQGGQIGGRIGGQIGGQIRDQVALTARQLQVFELIKANSAITRKKIAEQLKINESAIQKHMNILKNKGLIERVGKTRGATWKISHTVSTI